MAATLVTVVFAWKASRDGHKAAVAAQETVTTAGEIAEATRNTVTELRNVAEHARQTVETAQEPSRPTNATAHHANCATSPE